jgi:hypothetical protein
MRLGRNSGGEKHRIDRDPRAVCRLAEPDAPAEEGVLGQRGGGFAGGLGGLGRNGIGPGGLGCGQRSSSSAAAISARARW